MYQLLVAFSLIQLYAFIPQEKQLVVYDVKRVARLTGKSTIEENLPNPNRTDERFNLGGTDLGIAWDMGKGKTGFFFGDSYGSDFKQVKAGGPGNAGNWRSNVLAISTDNQLEDGITFDTMISKQVIYSPHITDGTGSHTAIPTAAIHIGEKDYVHYMDVRKWGNAGNWTTNFSALYSSKDGGKVWLPCKEVRFAALSNFAQVGYAKKDGYVYMMGTKPGRSGGAYLSRFKQNDILNQAEYEYWNKIEGWKKGDESQASLTIDAPVGELSIAYHTGLKKWLLTYLNGQKGDLVIRYATEINGKWSEEQTLVSGKEYHGLYGAFIHPAKLDGNDLYFTMSLWWPYNVFLMKASLKLS